MPISYDAARANLYFLRHQHPSWSQAELAAALKCSKSWVAKWLKRFGEDLASGQRLEQVLQGRSRARKTPPTPTHPLVVEQVLAIRDQPPEGLRRVPGKAPIHSDLQRDPLLQFFQLPVPSCKTIYRLLKSHQRIPERGQRSHRSWERPAPMTVWQIDFKDVSSVPADPEGKRQHVVETLNIIDMGTSVLLDAHVRSDFTAETAKARPGSHPGSVWSTRVHHPGSRYALGGQSKSAVIFLPPCCALEPVWASRSCTGYLGHPFEKSPSGRRKITLHCLQTQVG